MSNVNTLLLSQISGVPVGVLTGDSNKRTSRPNIFYNLTTALYNIHSNTDDITLHKLCRDLSHTYIDKFTLLNKYDGYSCEHDGDIIGTYIYLITQIHDKYIGRTEQYTANSIREPMYNIVLEYHEFIYLYKHSEYTSEILSHALFEYAKKHYKHPDSIQYSTDGLSDVFIASNKKGDVSESIVFEHSEELESLLKCSLGGVL